MRWMPKLLDGPFEVQRVTDGKQYGEHVTFRVTGKAKAKVATCSCQDNAELVATALNAVAAEPWAWCTTDVNGVPQQIVQQPAAEIMQEQGLKLTPLYRAARPEEKTITVMPIIHNNHEWPRFSADVTGMTAIHWKAADGGYRWMLLAEAISGKTVSVPSPLAANFKETK